MRRAPTLCSIACSSRNAAFWNGSFVRKALAEAFGDAVLS